MSARAQRNVFLTAAAALGVVLLWAMTGLPPAGVYRGPYGDVLNAVAVQQTHAVNVVNAVVLDYRAADTLIEEYILFAAVLGVTVLLRGERGEEEGPVREEAAGRHVRPISPAVRVQGLALTGPTVLLAVYVVAHGHLSPGGGFQAGLILATAALFTYLVGGYAVLRRTISSESLVELTEAVGAGGFVVVGLAGLATGAAFLTNVLPPGTAGSLAAAGVMPVLNVAVALEVAAAFVLLIVGLLEQAVRRRRQHAQATETATSGGR